MDAGTGDGFCPKKCEKKGGKKKRLKCVAFLCANSAELATTRRLNAYVTLVGSELHLCNEKRAILRNLRIPYFWPFRPPSKSNNS